MKEQIVEKQPVKYAFGRLLFLTLFSVIWWGCPTEVNDPPAPPQPIKGPQNLALKIGAVPGGNTFASVSWVHSEDQGRADFKGYRVTTYELNQNNDVISIFQEQAIQKNSVLHVIDSLILGVRYRTVVSAETIDGVKSDTISTPVYGGVFYNINGEVEEFTADGVSKSGYGWNTAIGTGFIYDYGLATAPLIDIHLRKSTNDRLYFYSPIKYWPGVKSTRLALIGQGQDAFDRVILPEADSDSVEVNLNNVYLLKTQENKYIKVWVLSIETITAPNATQFRRIKFDYKIQPITGLRVL